MPAVPTKMTGWGGNFSNSIAVNGFFLNPGGAAFQGNPTFPAGSLIAGDVIRIQAYGSWGTGAGGQPLSASVMFPFETSLIAIPLANLTLGLPAGTVGIWRFDCNIIIYPTSQSYRAFALFTASAGAFFASVESASPTAFAVSPVAPQSIDFVMQFTNLNPVNTVGLGVFTIEHLRGGCQEMIMSPLACRFSGDCGEN